jgi:8-oxo-dGTP pyrophosphatase MutT (NUDIX family)
VATINPGKAPGLSEEQLTTLNTVPGPGVQWVVGALVTDGAGRIYAHRRTPERKLFPGCWDVAGGHVEPGETLHQALSRELYEETGWELDDVLGLAQEFEWESGGLLRHEIDYVVSVRGNVTSPRLEEGKADSFGWFNDQNLDTLLENRSIGDTAIYDMVRTGLALLTQ